MCLHCDNILERSRVCSVRVLPTCRAFNGSRLWVSDGDTPLGLQPADRVNSAAAFTYLMRTISAYNCELQLQPCGAWFIHFSIIPFPDADVFRKLWNFHVIAHNRQLHSHVVYWNSNLILPFSPFGRFEIGIWLCRSVSAGKDLINFSNIPVDALL